VKYTRRSMIVSCAASSFFSVMAIAEESHDKESDAVPLAESNRNEGSFSGNFNFDEHHKSLSLMVDGSLAEQFRREDFFSLGGAFGYETKGDIGGGIHVRNPLSLSFDIIHIDGKGEVERGEEAYDISGIAEYVRGEGRLSDEDNAITARAEAALGFGFARTWYVGDVPDNLDHLRVLAQHTRTIFFIGFWAARFYVKRPPHDEQGSEEVFTDTPDASLSAKEDFNSYGPALIFRSCRRSGASFDVRMLGLPAPRHSSLAMPHAELVAQVGAPLSDSLFLFGNVTLITSNHDDAHQHGVFTGFTGLGVHF